MTSSAFRNVERFRPLDDVCHAIEIIVGESKKLNTNVIVDIRKVEVD